MMQRAIRALQRNGVVGTAQIALERSHVLAHLSVVTEMLRHPRHAAPWLRDRLSGDSPVSQGMPWIAWPCVDFLDSYLRPGHVVLEWGGGGSTIYFLRKGCRVTTVESSDQWVKELTARVDALGADCRARWDLRFVPAKDNQDPLIAEYVDQVTRGGPWDAVLVDGWSRFTCLLAARPYVKVGGVLLLDNANQAQFADVPSVMKGCEHRRFRGLGVARSWVTRTDAYIRRAASTGA